ncbi:restriction endonuclease subunit S [Nitrosomonas sp.]|uniref:restriction endonuclease subunit S n=1 Tax=Nitrosomonas sp. TaxID=42353 RepID=UPI0025F6F78E|nr:restriction endonuclease subunit S [Nitrosomonas sp.]
MIKLLPLNEVSEVIRGVTFGSEQSMAEELEDYLPVIRAGNISEKLELHDDLVWVPSKLIKDSQKIRYQDIIMCTSSGSAEIVGKIARADEDWNGSFGAFCAGIRPNKKIIDPSYLFHFLSSPEFKQWTRKSSGANIKNIRKSELEQFKIPLPSLEEQKRIAAILDKADAIRRKRQQAIDLTDQLLRSVFLELFGDPVTNPKGWKKIALQNVVSEVIDCPHSTPRWTENGKVAIRTSNLTAGGWNWSDKRYVSEEEYHDRSKRSYVEPGDIILSREGTVGIAAIVQEDMEICLGQRLVQLRPNLGIANSEYILHILLYELEPERLERAMVGATSKHLNVKELRELEIPLPLLELQDNFKKTVNKITMYKSRLARAALLDENLFSALTQNAFSGELSQVA